MLDAPHGHRLVARSDGRLAEAVDGLDAIRTVATCGQNLGVARVELVQVQYRLSNQAEA